MEHIVINGSVHTARKQHQRVQICLWVLWGLRSWPLFWRADLSSFVVNQAWEISVSTSSASSYNFIFTCWALDANADRTIENAHTRRHVCERVWSLEKVNISLHTPGGRSFCLCYWTADALRGRSLQRKQQKYHRSLVRTSVWFAISGTENAFSILYTHQWRLRCKSAHPDVECESF